jgi:Leucine-rich repeat (LRR) protein
VLQVLRLTGNALTRPPTDISYYRELKELYLGSNKLVDVKWVFECRALQHAGLSYNAVASLPLSLPSTNLVRPQSSPRGPSGGRHTVRDHGVDEA